MIPLLTFLCTIICIANTIYFTFLYKTDAHNSAESWLTVSANTFNERWGEIRNGILDVAGSNELSVLVGKVMSGESNHLLMQSGFQSPIRRMTSSSSLITGTYFITSDNTIYSTYTDRISDETSPLLDYSNFKDLEKITFLGATTSPFVPGETVIPVAVPLSILNMSDYLAMGYDSNDSVDIVMVCLLDSKALYTELNRGQSSYFDSSCFLFDTHKKIILFPSDISLLDDKDYTILTSRTSVEGLDIALAISISSYLPRKLMLIVFCLLVALIVIAIGTILIVSFSNFLTRPFKNLMRMVDEIKHNCYHQEIIPKFNDETGELIQALNSMHITIQNQITLIRETEKQKYQYMEQVLTEQINPHFIYNTLETINMEIVGRHPDTAAELVRTFATFLRCNLNNGKELTTIEGETKQASAYMMIMNQRLNSKIQFSCQVDESIKSFSIPKSILQPMIENSIKHGFNNGMPTSSILLPSIIVTIHHEGDSIIFEVTDNGMGIDIEKAQNIIATTTESRHIGLRNIYRRLELYFGSIDMRFSSIPYFKNTITITIPFTELEQSDSP